ncbi:MAG TPA: hypothetical protein VHJ18_10595 [Streptosporangiaceae bacterium]|nr:hypothetical protein [Streptosporangiaceae bacterium]
MLDNIFGADVVRWLELIRSRPRRLVVLRPGKDVVAARDAAYWALAGYLRSETVADIMLRRKEATISVLI